MSKPALHFDPVEERVLILTPTGRDASLVCEALQEAGISAERAATVDVLCREIEKGSGAALVGEESLTPAGLPRLIGALCRQPVWSDLPLIVLTGGGETTEAISRKLQNPVFPLNLTLLERPVRKATLVTTIQSALRARRRQYEIRDNLLERKKAEEQIRSLNEELERRVVERTAQLEAANQELRKEIDDRKRAEIILEREHQTAHLLRVVAEAANLAPGIDSAIQSTLYNVCTRLGWQVGHAFLWYEGPKVDLVSTGIWHLEDPEMFCQFQEASHALLDRGAALEWIASAIRTRKAIWIEDASGDAAFARAEAAKAVGIKTGLAAPVWVGQRIVAVLEFFSTEAREPDPHLLENVMRQVGIQLGRVFERSEADQKLREQERLATIGQTAAVFAHEVSNPLNGMAASIQLLNRKLAHREEFSNDEIVSAGLQGLSGEINRLASLLQNFRSLARPQQLDLVPVDVADLAKDVLALEAPLYSERGIQIEVDCPADLPRIMGDRDKLKQVLLNLCKNAVDAMPSGGKLTVKAYGSEEHIHLHVIDTGTGIPEGLQAFEPFVTTKSQGTGLGLMIVKQIVTDHEGTISHASEPGKGTTIELKFPLCLSSEGKPPYGFHAAPAQAGQRTPLPPSKLVP